MLAKFFVFPLYFSERVWRHCSDRACLVRHLRLVSVVTFRVSRACSRHCAFSMRCAHPPEPVIPCHAISSLTVSCSHVCAPPRRGESPGYMLLRFSRPTGPGREAWSLATCLPPKCGQSTARRNGVSPSFFSSLSLFAPPVAGVLLGRFAVVSRQSRLGYELRLAAAVSSLGSFVWQIRAAVLCVGPLASAPRVVLCAPWERR